jgi:uncharacterized protein
MKREAAWRVFAGEYNDSTVEIKGEGDMAPSYVITPLGAKVNRLFVIGVLTDVENISEGGDLVRAHISDPTGVFTLYSGSYQKEITDALSEIQSPAFVAVIGKVRTYKPEDSDDIYVSIRPEHVMEVDVNVRDRWILETCKNTKDRIEAVLEAMKMNESNEFELRKLGFSKELCEGIVVALKNYKNIDLSKYVKIIQESIQYLVPGKDNLLDIKPKKYKEIIKEEIIEEKISKSEEKTDDKKEENEDLDKDFVEIEENVLEVIKETEGEDGASWDTITKKCEKQGLDKNNVEEALASLMDKGLIYEPVLGTIKTT